MKLSISTTGVDRLAQSIREFSKTGGGLHSRKLWGRVGQVLRAESMECFKRQRAPDGTPWPPLKESTLRAKSYRRTRKYRSGQKKWGYQTKKVRSMMSKDKILMDTGKLRASVTTEHTDRSVKVGSRLVYARTHQEGSPKNNIPARPFLGASENGKDRILNVIWDHVKKEIDKVGD